ncbi:Uncharacterized protein Fot_37073 [Forsythia ovata]|uniref:Uncharacterized protein n=1 Tax=Forsythia ovata TaxID=205694 RepID=A0ABD1SR89_9LAMI
MVSEVSRQPALVAEKPRQPKLVAEFSRQPKLVAEQFGNHNAYIVKPTPNAYIINVGDIIQDEIPSCQAAFCGNGFNFRGEGSGLNNVGRGGDGGIGSEEGDEVGVDSNYISNFQNESGHQAAVDVPKFLHPYDRASETLFSPVAAYYLLRINAIHAIGNT